MTLRLTSSALALAAMTAPALADVTPEQVMQSWIDYYQTMGYSVTEGGRSKDGSTLTLTDVVFAGGTPEGTVNAWLVPGPQREQVLGQLSYQIGSGVARGADGRLWHSTVLGNNCR